MFFLQESGRNLHAEGVRLLTWVISQAVPGLQERFRFLVLGLKMCFAGLPFLNDFGSPTSKTRGVQEVCRS
jgi:hypothetical protein